MPFEVTLLAVMQMTGCANRSAARFVAPRRGNFGCSRFSRIRAARNECGSCAPQKIRMPRYELFATVGHRSEKCYVVSTVRVFRNSRARETDETRGRGGVLQLHARATRRHQQDLNRRHPPRTAPTARRFEPARSRLFGAKKMNAARERDRLPAWKPFGQEKQVIFMRRDDDLQSVIRRVFHRHAVEMRFRGIAHFAKSRRDDSAISIMNKFEREVVKRSTRLTASGGGAATLSAGRACDSKRRCIARRTNSRVSKSPNFSSSESGTDRTRAVAKVCHCRA